MFNYPPLPPKGVNLNTLGTSIKPRQGREVIEEVDIKPKETHKYTLPKDVVELEGDTFVYLHTNHIGDLLNPERKLKPVDKKVNYLA